MEGNGLERARYMRTVHDEAGTAAIAAALAAHAEPGMLLALDGDLGAGKTLFAQRFAAALGVPGIVNSPTFTIIKEYEGGKLPFYHMDVYRVTMDEADELGLDEYFFGAGVTLVEWASRIVPLLPDERLDVTIEVAGPTARRFVFQPQGLKYAQWCANAGIIPAHASEGERK